MDTPSPKSRSESSLSLAVGAQLGGQRSQKKTQPSMFAATLDSGSAERALARLAEPSQPRNIREAPLGFGSLQAPNSAAHLGNGCGKGIVRPAFPASSRLQP